MTRLETPIAIYFALLAATAFPYLASAQDVDLQRVEMPGGDFVPDITEDQNGMLWFATQEGLVRYDGRVYRVYQHDSLDASSISYNYVEAVHVDGDGTLWVGTYGGGLNRYDRETESFVRYRHDPDDPHSLSHDNVTAILEDRGGVLWIGTRGGLNRLNRETGRFTRYVHDPDDPSSISNDWARALYEDRDGRFWVGTHGGLNLFDREAGTFTRFLHEPGNYESLIEGRISTILEDSQGQLWIGTGRSTGGLNLMDRDKGEFARYRFDDVASNWPTEPQPEGPWTGGGITTIAEGADGVLWLGNWEGWVTRFDPKTGTAENYNLRALNPSATAEMHPFRIFQSSDGTVWIGSVDGPLYRAEPR